ncbi:MAG: L-alanine-DL-glutamate epimerase [Candidatus Latescibacteria bacterium]|nr:L-alanine-DL-glutamate epimerase [Candidatus Latescibacterota bacterium]
MHIVDTALEIQREPFAQPFGFKGSSFHEKWNLIVRLTDSDGREAFGVGGLAVLWSDPDIFAGHTEVGGNLLQAAILEHALQLVKERSFADPRKMFSELLPEVHEYGQSITGSKDLNLTFSMIALVALDNAAWVLHARQRGITTFDDLIPPHLQHYLNRRQATIATVPAVGYNMTGAQLTELLERGAFLLKIKIGQPGSEEDMLQADMKRLSEIHALAERHETEGTESGHVAYYLDANGRYKYRETMARLLEHAERNDMLSNIVLVEEPFQEPDVVAVHGLPALFAADESLQTVEDVSVRAAQGYGAVTIKPAGKTLSMSFDMIEAALRANAIPFVADNACVPVLVEWNKNVAARLPDFPGIRGGILESNGPENYGAWQRLLSEFPILDAPWLSPRDGRYVLGDEYYRESGGIFREPTSYTRLIR